MKPGAFGDIARARIMARHSTHRGHCRCRGDGCPPMEGLEMNTPNPKDVPVDEVWEVATPNAQSKYRWIAVRNSPSGLSPWHMVFLGAGGYRRGMDDEITLIRRLTPEVNDDDPIAYSIRQSQVDAVEVEQDEDGRWRVDGRIVADRTETRKGIDIELEYDHTEDIVGLLAVRQVMSAEQDQVRDRLRTIAPEADESTLATLAANPSILAALGGGRYA